MLTVLPFCLSSSAFAAAFLRTLTLKPPARPLSPAITIISVFFFSTFVVKTDVKLLSEEMSHMALNSVSKNGCTATALSLARRIFEVATSCMALVICLVLSTLLIRLFTSFILAVAIPQRSLLGFKEFFHIIFKDFLDSLLVFRSKLFGLGYRGIDIRVAFFYLLEKIHLKLPHHVHRDIL